MSCHSEIGLYLEKLLRNVPVFVTCHISHVESIVDKLLIN